MARFGGLRVVAVFEAAKGFVVLLAGFGLLSLIDGDAQAMAEALVRHMHLNPAGHYPTIFINVAAHASDRRLWLLAILAALYALIRWTEAYGLWRQRAWAEWFAAVSGSIYIPLEVYELLKGVSAVKVFTLVANIVVVAYMSYVLWRARRAARMRG